MEESKDYFFRLRDKLKLIKELHIKFLSVNSYPAYIGTSKYLPELRDELIETQKIVEEIIEFVDGEKKS